MWKYQVKQKQIIMRPRLGAALSVAPIHLSICLSLSPSVHPVLFGWEVQIGEIALYKDATFEFFR